MPSLNGVDRRPGWERRLIAVLAEASTKPYKLGEHDCFRLACRAIEALTGVDFWAEWGAYSNEREAARLIARAGQTWDGAFSNAFGVVPISPRLARRGDVVKYVGPGGLNGRVEPHLGVCVGATVAVLAERGLMYVPLAACEHCWRVGA